MLLNNILMFLSSVRLFISDLILNRYFLVQLQVQNPELLRALPEWWKQSDNL